MSRWEEWGPLVTNLWRVILSWDEPRAKLTCHNDYGMTCCMMQSHGDAGLITTAMTKIGCYKTPYLYRRKRTQHYSPMLAHFKRWIVFQGFLLKIKIKEILKLLVLVGLVYWSFFFPFFPFFVIESHNENTNLHVLYAYRWKSNFFMRLMAIASTTMIWETIRCIHLDKRRSSFFLCP